MWREEYREAVLHYLVINAGIRKAFVEDMVGDGKETYEYGPNVDMNDDEMDRWYDETPYEDFLKSPRIVKYHKYMKSWESTSPNRNRQIFIRSNLSMNTSTPMRLRARTIILRWDLFSASDTVSIATNRVRNAKVEG